MEVPRGRSGGARRTRFRRGVARDVRGDARLAAVQRRGLAVGERLDILLRGERNAGLPVGDGVDLLLIEVEIGIDPHARLPLPERRRDERVDLRRQLVRVGTLGLELGCSPADAAGRQVTRPEQHAGLVGDRDVFGLQPLDARRDETGDAADRVRADRRATVEQDGGARLDAVVEEERLFRQDELHGRRLNSLNPFDRARDLAFEGALIGDLLLEIGRAELLLVEDLVADVAAVRQAVLGERDPRGRLLALLDHDDCAAVTQLVRDARALERLGDLAALARRETAGDDRPVWSRAELIEEVGGGEDADRARG